MILGTVPFTQKRAQLPLCRLFTMIRSQSNVQTEAKMRGMPSCDDLHPQWKALRRRLHWYYLTDKQRSLAEVVPAICFPGEIQWRFAR